MINYLFSGIDRINGFTEVQTNYLIKDVKCNSIITFISSMPTDYERNDKQLSQYREMFYKIGINFSKSTVIDKRLNKDSAKKKIENSDIVFLLGGTPELQMKFINEYELLKIIKNVPIVIGVSAGSLNQSKRVIYRDDFDNYSVKDYKGLGIVDINIFPHIDLNNKQLMAEVDEISKIIPLILLPNDSFIRIENGDIKIIGEYYN